MAIVKKLLLEWSYRTGTREFPIFGGGIDLINLCRKGFRAEIRPRTPDWMTRISDINDFLARCRIGGCEICNFRKQNGCYCDGVLPRLGYATPEIFYEKITVGQAILLAPCGKHGINKPQGIRLF